MPIQLFQIRAFCSNPDLVLEKGRTFAKAISKFAFNVLGETYLVLPGGGGRGSDDMTKLSLYSV